MRWGRKSWKKGWRFASGAAAEPWCWDSVLWPYGASVYGVGQTRVMTSEHRFVTSRLQAKHCPASRFGNFMFCSLHVFLQTMMKTLSDICRSCLARQLWLSANSSAEQVWKCLAWQKGRVRCRVYSGLGNYSCRRWQALRNSPSWLWIDQQESWCSSGCFPAVTYRIYPQPRKSCFWDLAKKTQIKLANKKA